MYINNKEEGGSNVTSANLTVAQKLVNTYGTLIQSDLILEQVIQETGILRSTAQVRRMVSTTSVNGTEIFAVYVTRRIPRRRHRSPMPLRTLRPRRYPALLRAAAPNG